MPKTTDSCAFPALPTIPCPAAATLAAIVLCVPVPMAAQDDEQPAATVVDSVTVTAAEKRETDLQTTPVSMTAFSAEDLEGSGVERHEDLQFQVPTLTFGVLFADTQISIRGIGNENLTPGGDPGVALHVDGVYMGRSSAAFVDYLDIDRVEVLRGPQGTLYGRNTTGGSINVLTSRSSEDFNGRFDIGVGNYDLYHANGSIGGALGGDRVFGLLSAATRDRDGYHENTLPRGGLLDDNRYTAVRGRLDFDLSDRSRLGLSGYHHDQGGAGSAAKNLNDGIADPRQSQRDVAQNQDNGYSGFTLLYTLAGDSVELVSLSGYQELTTDLFLDGDGTAVPFQTLSTVLDSEQLSTELRVGSTSGGAGRWQLGLFYFDEEVVSDFELQDLFLGPYLIDSLVDTQNLAFFGHYAHNVSDSVRLYAGARYNDDEKDAVDQQFFPFFGLDFGIPQSLSYSEVTGDVGVDVQLSDSSFFYAKYSRSYKSGGFNLPGDGLAYDPEFVNAFEIGTKNLLSANRVRLNAALFHYDYEDMQVFQIRNFQTLIENAAQSTIDGLEVDLEVRPSSRSRIDFFAAWLDAEYDEFVSLNPRNPFAGLQDLSGNRLNRAPEFEFGLGLQHSFEVGDGARLTPRLESSWRDDVNFRQFNLPEESQESFTRSDFRLMWESRRGRYRAQAYVENIEDDDVIGNILINAVNLSATYYAPRTYGFTFGLRSP